MKKANVIANLAIIFIIIIVSVGIYLIRNPERNVLYCAGQGQMYDLNDDDMPKKCCSGLVNVNVQNQISVEDVCFSVGKDSGSNLGLCSACGNGICDSAESVCSCKQDCLGKSRSTYLTIADFCKNGYNSYCTNIPALELCKICNI